MTTPKEVTRVITECVEKFRAGGGTLVSGRYGVDSGVDGERGFWAPVDAERPCACALSAVLLMKSAPVLCFGSVVESAAAALGISQLATISLMRGFDGSLLGYYGIRGPTGTSEMDRWYHTGQELARALRPKRYERYP